MANTSFKMSLKNVSQTPRKIGQVVALVRNRSLSDALVILEHTPRRPAKVLSKLLKNSETVAKSTHRLQPASLKVAAIHVTHGPRLKRWRTIARKHYRTGRRPHPRIQRSSHVFVTLEGEIRPTNTDRKLAAKTGGADGTKS